MMRRATRQSGQTLIAVIFITAIAALLVLASLSWAQSSVFQTANSNREDIALEAAQAGVQVYVSRLVENPQYWLEDVDTAEDPRTNSSTGAVVAPGTAWPTGASWTYPSKIQTWHPLQNARFGQANYNIRVFPDPTDQNSVLVQSTAEVGTGPPVVRSVEAQISPDSIANYQMISNASISYGSTATTTGKIYSAQDVVHQGTALGAIYAEHEVCRNDSSGATCLKSDATDPAFSVGGAYDSTTTPSCSAKFPTPIDFTTFTGAISNIEAAAQATGVYENSSAVSAWEIQFQSSGHVLIFPVTNTSDPGVSIGTLGCPTSVAMPSGNAPFYMYFQQPVIVGDDQNITDACRATSGERDSVVNGQVTVASQSNLYIGGNISYASGTSSVLGLIAANNVIISQFAPQNLSWRAATLAQSGEWMTDTSSTTHSSMTFTGSIATAQGGYASMFGTRTYNYDTVLQTLRPPLFPVIENSWAVQYWHEVTPPAV
jgi:type II secretory pathway pseudopilin PulG